MASRPGCAAPSIDSIFRALSRRLPTLIREAIELQATQPSLPITGRFSSGKQRAADRGGDEGRRVSLRSRPAGRERPSVHRRRGRRHPRHHQARPRRSVHGPAGRACTRPAMRCTTSACRANGARSRWAEDRGIALEESPVAAVRDDRLPQPRRSSPGCGRCSRSTSASAARSGKWKTCTAC